ncbi:hypothetical protein FQN54_001311 [Arachnomyces sp. PD_36]|nr:hypothetical protein FQN54_001311 [Arachnomyces sp. PD_36]
MDRLDPEETSRKRLKVSQEPDTSITPQSLNDSSILQSRPAEDSQEMKEAEVGITHFVSPGIPGFSGVLKKRYTDFLVNEIVPSGEVLHLQSLTPKATQSTKPQNENASLEEASKPEPAPEQPAEIPNRGGNENGKAQAVPESSGKIADDGSEFQLTAENNSLLESYFGAETVQKILELYKQTLLPKKARSGKPAEVKSAPISDRSLRTSIHQAIRTIFSSRLESSTSKDGAMVISEGSSRSFHRQGQDQNQPRERKPKPNWEELGGDYLHFTIYKENKDTMEVVSYLARQMKLNPKFFQFAGTKDRRGVTVQRASCYRTNANRFAPLNRSLRNACVGDFKYEKQGLELGELGGNEFVITLRDCQFPGIDAKGDENCATRASEIVSQALNCLREKGYFNYYGLQRFGTFSTRTDTVGVKMLQGDFQGACEAIMYYGPEALAACQDPQPPQGQGLQVGSDDKARAWAINKFQETGDAKAALDTLPRKFSAESNVIRHLGSYKNDFQGALKMIPRNLRLMYVHAYQSLVWNYAVGRRWDLFGDKVVEGDLVIVQDHKDKEEKVEKAEAPAEVDEDGEAIVRPDAEDTQETPDDKFTRARPLTAEEAASGNYNLFDVVLPLPGFDIIYPANAVGEFYQRFMSSDRGGGIDPLDMRRSWKDISLSGSYRKILSRPGPDYSFEVKRYAKEDEQFVKTDLELLKSNKARDDAKPSEEAADKVQEPADKLAVILKLQLGSSQYATMALRELMKTGGVKTYKADFGGGR